MSDKRRFNSIVNNSKFPATPAHSRCRETTVSRYRPTIAHTIFTRTIHRTRAAFAMKVKLILLNRTDNTEYPNLEVDLPIVPVIGDRIALKEFWPEMPDDLIPVWNVHGRIWTRNKIERGNKSTHRVSAILYLVEADW